MIFGRKSPPLTSDPSRRTRHTLGLVLASLGLLLSTGCGKNAEAREGQSSGPEIYERRCAACHGVDGHGNQQVAAPSIAGLEAWYVTAQVQKFRAGHRGLDPNDLPGMRMRPMALSLGGEKDIEMVAEHVSFMKRKNDAAITITDGDPQRGQGLFAPCAACHGFTGEGNTMMKAPPLAGTEDWYLYNQLNNFRTGSRGTNPDDATGALMRPNAQALTDDQAVKDVVAYIATLRAFN